MRTKTVIRYYCDHCSKGGFRKPDMMQHESNCTKNPKRGCATCEAVVGTFDCPALAAEFKKRPDIEQHEKPDGSATDYFSTDSKAAIAWLSDKVDGCPTCMLAVLQQSGVMAFEAFDYKEWMSEWHREKHATEVMYDQ